MPLDPIIQALVDQVRTIRETVQKLDQRDVPARNASGLPVYTGLTPGRVVFVGTDEALADSVGLRFDATDYAVRVTRNSASGGAIVQSPLTANTTFTRAVFAHNAYWDDASALWQVGAIGANDVSAILVENGGQLDFIIHPSTGNVARAFTHANFVAGAKMTLTTAGNLSVTGSISSAAGQIATTGAAAGFLFQDRTTGSPNWQWYSLGGGASSLARLYNGTGDVFTVDTNGVVNTTGNLQRGGTQLLTTRRTGWTAATGTATRTTYATTTVTLPQLAERVKALIDDLITHGIIGA